MLWKITRGPFNRATERYHWESSLFDVKRLLTAYGKLTYDTPQLATRFRHEPWRIIFGGVGVWIVYSRNQYHWQLWCLVLGYFAFFARDGDNNGIAGLQWSHTPPGLSRDIWRIWYTIFLAIVSDLSLTRCRLCAVCTINSAPMTWYFAVANNHIATHTPPTTTPTNQVHSTARTPKLHPMCGDFTYLLVRKGSRKAKSISVNVNLKSFYVLNWF